MNLYYLPYHMKSMSVVELQDVLGGFKIKLQGTNYAHKAGNLVVNWGHGDIPPWATGLGRKPNILNYWLDVANAINKLKAFQIFGEKGVPIPEWTTSKAKASDWIAAGGVAVARTKLSSMEGRGIKVASVVGELVDAPLYTKLFLKEKEYRIHVFKGQIIDSVQKKLREGAKDIPNRSKYIRNTANGWIFAREGVVVPTAARDAATLAINALGLDFGAVDLAVSKSGKVVVFEVNTAPGLEGTTVTKYAEAIKSYKTQLETA